MKLHRILFGALFATSAVGALAQTSASGLITLLSQSGSTYNYDIKLNNTGSTGIQTFWFSWVPGENFMPDMPTSISQPSGWVDGVTGGTGGYAIQWKTTGGLASNSSLDGFLFSSVDSPTILEGSIQSTPILTAVVYSGQPLIGTSDQFVVQFNPAPEPSGWVALGGLACVALIARRRRLIGAQN